MSNNLSTREKRELYKAWRSAHDGICPMCGSLANTLDDATVGMDLYRCSSVTKCQFRLTAIEVQTISGWRGLFHTDLSAALFKLRGA